MRTTKRDEAKQERKAVADVATQLAALQAMSVGELREEWRRVFGEPTRSRNKDFLRKKVAWRIQEVTEGGLSDRAKARIEELADGATIRTRRQPMTRDAGVGEGSTRDARLPPPGSTITRVYKGTEHRVTILEDGAFEHDGHRYRSLSVIAKKITSTAWNGFLFFNLIKRGGEPTTVLA